jgi:hypothetical protein
MSSLWNGLEGAVSGVASKVANGYNSAKNVVSGVASKVAGVAKTVGHHAIDGLKTAGHLMAEHAPSIASAALGAIGDHIVPGLGGAAGRALGDRLGQGVKNWHSEKYGKNASANAATGTGRMIRALGKRVGRVGKAVTNLANMATEVAPQPKKPKAPAVPYLGGYRSNNLR